MAKARSPQKPKKRPLASIHPGEILSEDVMVPANLSISQFAKDLAIPAARLNNIVRGRRGITADTALRLARCLGMSAKFWMSLQADYDLRLAQQKVGPKIDRQVKTRNAAV
jgi:addiction module HigA family antidote